MGGCLGAVVVFLLVMFGVGACISSQLPETSEECQMWTDWGSSGGDPDVAWEMMKETC